MRYRYCNRGTSDIVSEILAILYELRNNWMGGNDITSSWNYKMVSYQSQSKHIFSANLHSRKTNIWISTWDKERWRLSSLPQIVADNNVGTKNIISVFITKRRLLMRGIIIKDALFVFHSHMKSAIEIMHYWAGLV